MFYQKKKIKRIPNLKLDCEFCVYVDKIASVLKGIFTGSKCSKCSMLTIAIEMSEEKLKTFKTHIIYL